MSYMPTPKMEISSILSEGTTDVTAQDALRRHSKSQRSQQQQQQQQPAQQMYHQQSGNGYHDRQQHYASGGNHHSARMRMPQANEPAPMGRGQHHLDPALELKRGERAHKSRSHPKRSQAPEHLQVDTPPMPSLTAEISRENIVESNRRNHFSFSSDALPLSETVQYPMSAGAYVERTPQQQMRHCEQNGRSAYPTPNPNSPTTSRDARNSIGSASLPMNSRVWATPAPSEEEEAAMTLVFLQASERAERASPREPWFPQGHTNGIHHELPRRNIEGDIDSDSTEAQYRMQMPYTPASVQESRSTHIKRESGDFNTDYFVTRTPLPYNPYHTPNEQQELSDRMDEDVELMSEDFKDEDYRDETYGMPKKTHESHKKRPSLSAMPPSKKSKPSSHKSSSASSRRGSKIIPAPLHISTTAVTSNSLKRPAEDDLSPIPAKRKTINSASSQFIDPITPTSTTTPHTHKPSKPLSASKTANADEEIGRRCMRCRKSKKGCDRQRPCQRCKDAGIPKEQCISEDETGRKKKGAQQKPKKTGHVALAAAPMNSTPSIAASGGGGQMSPILPDAAFAVPARPSKSSKGRRKSPK